MTTDRRTDVGAAGERIAAWWLTERGIRIVATNVELAGGEIDIIARDGYSKVAVEVRAVTGGGDPIDAIGEAKRSRVRRLAGQVGANRVDFIGVAMDSSGFEVHWLPG